MLDFLETGNFARMSFILIVAIIILIISILELSRRITKQKYTVLDDRLMLDISPMILIKGVFVSFYTTFLDWVYSWFLISSGTC